MSSDRILVLDTETSGFVGVSDAAPLEIGAVVVDIARGSICASFSSLSLPWQATRPGYWDRRGVQEALRVNQLTAEQVQAAPPSVQVAVSFGFWAMMYNVDRVAAYPAAFDIPMVRRLTEEGRDHGMASVSRLWQQLDTALCLVPIVSQILQSSGVTVRKVAAYGPMVRLSYAAAFFDVPVEGPAHRALPDAITTARVLLAVLRWPENPSAEMVAAARARYDAATVAAASEKMTAASE